MSHGLYIFWCFRPADIFSISKFTISLTFCIAFLSEIKIASLVSTTTTLSRPIPTMSLSCFLNMSFLYLLIEHFLLLHYYLDFFRIIPNRLPAAYIAQPAFNGITKPSDVFSITPISIDNWTLLNSFLSNLWKSRSCYFYLLIFAAIYNLWTEISLILLGLFLP